MRTRPLLRRYKRGDNGFKLHVIFKATARQTLRRGFVLPLAIGRNEARASKAGEQRNKGAGGAVQSLFMPHGSSR